MSLRELSKQPVVTFHGLGNPSVRAAACSCSCSCSSFNSKRRGTLLVGVRVNWALLDWAGQDWPDATSVLWARRSP